MLFIKHVRAICLANFQYSSNGMGVLNNLSTTRRFYLRIWIRINIKKDSGNFILLVNLFWDFQFLLGRVARFPFGWRNLAGPMSCMLTANAYIQTATNILVMLSCIPCTHVWIYVAESTLGRIISWICLCAHHEARKGTGVMIPLILNLCNRWI
jgi:hypothetical protein